MQKESDTPSNILTISKKKLFKGNFLTKPVPLKELYEICFKQQEVQELKEKNDLIFGVTHEQHYNSANVKYAIAALKKLEPSNSWEHLITHITHSSGGLKVLKKAVKVVYANLTITTERRKQIWWIISGAKSRMSETPKYYDTLYLKYDDYPNIYNTQIDKDVKRTHPKTSEIHKEGCLKKMENILIAYSKRNNYVGYCQGMNFIVNNLVIRCREVEAFWILAHIIESILPIDYFTTMYTVFADQRIFTNLVRKHMPKLARHFVKIELDPGLFSLQWFMCLFTNAINVEMLNIVWDLLFIEGDVVLFKAGLILLNKIERDILKTKDMASALKVIEQKLLALNDCAKFKKELSNFYISKWIIEKLRYTYREKVIQELKENELNSKKRPPLLRANTSENIECKKEWPICAIAFKNKEKFKRSSSFFIFQSSSQPLTVIENYFSPDSVINRIVSLQSKPRKSEIIDLTKIHENPVLLSPEIPEILMTRDQHSENCISNNNELIEKKTNLFLSETISNEERFRTRSDTLVHGKEIGSLMNGMLNLENKSNYMDVNRQKSYAEEFDKFFVGEDRAETSSNWHEKSSFASHSPLLNTKYYDNKRLLNTAQEKSSGYQFDDFERIERLRSNAYRTHPKQNHKNNNSFTQSNNNINEELLNTSDISMKTDLNKKEKMLGMSDTEEVELDDEEINDQFSLLHSSLLKSSVVNNSDKEDLLKSSFSFQFHSGIFMKFKALNDFDI